MIAPPPPLYTTPSVPVGLSICAGLAGLAAAVGAGQSAFLRRFASISGQIDIFWGAVPQIAAIVLLIGAILALMQHEAGGPVLAGSGTVIAVVVATTVAGTRFEMEDFLDEFPLRGLLFLGGGLAGLVAAVLGLASLRGRGKPALGIVTAILAIGVLACHAAVVRLDDRQEAFNVRPFIGIAVIAAVMIFGSLIGRSGALAATAAAACLFPFYSDIAENEGFSRVKAAVVASIALGAIVAVSLVAAVLANRQQTVQRFAPAPSSAGWIAQTDAAQVYGAQPAAPVTQGTPGYGTPGYGTPGYEAPGYETPGYEATQPLPSIDEPTASMGAQFEPPPMAADSGRAASTDAQWRPDPSGRHQMRYWDGRQWTEYVSNGGVSGTDPI